MMRCSKEDSDDEDCLSMVEYKMGEVKKLLVYLESRECRQCMPPFQITKERKAATDLFRAYISIIQKPRVASNTHN
jgi:hypothetical protein